MSDTCKYDDKYQQQLIRVLNKMVEMHLSLKQEIELFKAEIKSLVLAFTDYVNDLTEKDEPWQKDYEEE